MTRQTSLSPAYYVGLIHVRDEAQWQVYVSQVGATICQYGGQVIFRGAKAQTMSGALAEEKIVTLMFADLAAATRWHESPEYQKLIPIRDAGADVTLVLYT
jgi:uncharacterized protein (DUF1330 family)